MAFGEVVGVATYQYGTGCHSAGVDCGGLYTEVVEQCVLNKLDIHNYDYHTKDPFANFNICKLIYDILCIYK